MGKKKALARGSECDSGWESTSTRSIAGCSDATQLESPDYIDLYSQNVDNLFEKRRDTREKALTALIGFMREGVRVEEALVNETTIISRCVNSIRRGGAAEAALACQLYGLHIMTLPQQQESHFREAQMDLQRAASSGESMEMRVAGVDTLALACYLCAEDDMCCLEVLDRLQALWSTGMAKVSAAALRGWCLVLTRLTTPLSQDKLEGALRQLAALLNAGDVDVRAAAGEVLALIYNCTRSGRAMLQQLSEGSGGGGGWEYDEDEGDDECEDEEPAKPLGSDGVTDEIVDRMRQLSAAHHHTLGGLRHSRKDRKALKSTFRGLLGSLERGSAPQAKVKLMYGDVLVVDSWEGNTQLSAVKKYLAGGFQVHLQRNPLLHMMFDFTPRPEPAARLSAAEKRMLKSPSSAESKWRANERKGDRAFKSARHAPVVYEDD